MGRSQRQKPSRPPRKSGQKSSKEAGFHFEATCFDGKTVYLSEGRWEWKILGSHPDMEGYEKTVRETAVDAQHVGYESDLEDMRIHASYDVGRGIHAKKYLWLPIRFTGDVGLILNSLSLGFSFLQQFDDILNSPKVIGHSGLHSGRDTQTLMNPNEVVIHEVERDGVV